MLTKIKKSKSIVASSAALLFLTLLLNLNKTNIEIFLFDTLESINAYDPGYSSLKEFLGLNTIVSLGENNTQIILGLAKNLTVTALPKVPNILYTKLTARDFRPEMDDIKFDIKFENLQLILEDRRQGLRDGILINPRNVNAQITYLGKQYKAKIRLKGDLPDHWRSSIRMSFRVTLKGGETILGMRRFSIHSPGSRQYPHEQVYQDFLDELGGITVPHKLLKVSVNGANWGVMNVEEHMSKELLEKQESKESIIFKFGDEQLWQYQKKHDNYYVNYKLSDPQIYSTIYQSEKYLSNKIYREQYSYFVDMYAEDKIHQHVSIQPALKAIILSGIWNNQHALNFANSKFYLNPYTLKLDTITTDQGPISYIDEPYSFVKDLEGFYTNFLVEQVEEEDFENITNDILLKKEKLLNFYSHHASFFPFDEPINRSVIDANIESIENTDFTFLRYLKSSKDKINHLEVVPPTKEQLVAMPAHVRVQHYDNGEIRVFNLLPMPVYIESISLQSKMIPIKIGTLPGSVHSIESRIFQSSFTGLLDGQVEVRSVVEGIKKKAINGVTLISNTHNPLMTNNNNIEKYPFIKKTKEGYSIDSGTWIFQEPLSIFGNLHINQGAKLIFKNDAYLIVKGSIKSMGTSKNKVEFSPDSGTWRGLYVLGDGSTSIVNFTQFNSTNELRDGILQLTGGVTFYNTELKMTNSYFSDAKGEDALNIIKSKFNIRNITIDRTFSDGLDFDFSNGSMNNSIFMNIGGDALDISGGNVQFHDMFIKDVKDKGISAGEGSRVQVDLSKIENIGVGIASKDGSRVLVNSTTINNSKLFDLMSYTKKNFFNDSSLVFTTNEETMLTSARQIGTRLYINDVSVKETKLDVDRLYETTVMSK